MEFILNLVLKSMEQVWGAWLHNWPYLAVSVVIATLLKLYVDGEKVAAFLNRYRRAGVVAATTAAVTTPLCSCGTTAVVLGLMASRMPWAPIVAFMVASPLTSPEGLVYSAGLFGWPFAWTFYLASIGLGLGGGWLAAVCESRGWLANQARFAEAISAPCACQANNPVTVATGPISLTLPAIKLSQPVTACGCAEAAPIALVESCCGQIETTPSPKRPGPGWGDPAVPAIKLSQPVTACGCAEAAPIALVESCGCGQVETTPTREKTRSGGTGGSTNPAHSNHSVTQSKPSVTLTTIGQELYRNGKYLVVMFTGFAFIGYFLNGLIPASWVAALFGNGNLYNVPLAATLGLPLYINSEASLPLIRALLDNGMSQGAALAFLIAGSGTSIGAIAGALTIARWRVIALVVGVLWGGAILSGFAFNLALMTLF